MKPIKLDVYHHTEETSTAKNVGMDYSMDDCELYTIIFYNIDAISPYYEKDKEFACIHCGGDEFISPYNMSELEEIIAKHNN